ncbi:LPS export ABC transporter permease LptF [Desulfolithobacter sp.]
MPRLRLPLLLYSYIATELLAPFFASAAILYCVFFLVRLMPILEEVLALRIGIGDFIRLFTYLSPHMLLYVLPMASMTGVIIGFTRMTTEREILALKACGVSIYQLALPVILVAAAITGITLLFSVHLVPAGKVAMRQLMFQLAREKIDRGIEAGTFTEALGNLVIYVDRVDRDRQWHGVYVSDMRGRKQPMITMARGGHMEADVERMLVTVVLEDGTLHHADGPDSQVIRFQRYLLQIPVKTPGGFKSVKQGKGSMTLPQLRDASKQAGPETRQGIRYLMELHKRLTLPVGCFILSLLGVPLGLQAAPGKRAIGIPLGLFFFIFYYILFTTGSNLVENRKLPLVFGMWMANGVLALITIYLFFRTEQEKSLVPEPVQNLFFTLWRRFMDPAKRKLVQLFARHIRGRRPTPRGRAAQDTHLLIHADPQRRIFHLPRCAFYHDRRCTIHFKDIQVAQRAGFAPCPFCQSLQAKEQKDM